MKPLAGVVLILPTLALFGCNETPEAPTAPALSAEFAVPAFAAGVTGRRVVMLDACDPASFNAFFGEEICTPVNSRGGISFSTFVALLEMNQRVDAWRFSPDRIQVPRTTTMAVPNLGGIVHTFTEVAEFGGGFVDLLNQLSGNLDPAPECLDFANLDIIPPGGHDEVTFEPGVEKKYMCCIHPWMRAVSM